MRSPKKRTPAKKPKPQQRPSMNDKDNIMILGSGTDSITVTDTVTLDLDYGAAQPALTSMGIDTITLDNMSSGTITLPHTSTYIGGGGGGGIYTTSGTSGYTWNNQGYSPTVNINDDGVNVKDNADIKIGQKSLKEFMANVEKRLAILTPDPEKLAKFASLKKAYEHYKTLEALCEIQEEDDKK